MTCIRTRKDEGRKWTGVHARRRREDNVYTTYARPIKHGTFPDWTRLNWTQLDSTGLDWTRDATGLASPAVSWSIPAGLVRRDRTRRVFTV